MGIKNLRDAIELKCLFSGDEKPEVEIVPEEIFINDLIHLMSGMDSSTFAFDNSTKSFSMRRPFVVKSVTPETLLGYTEKFILVR